MGMTYEDYAREEYYEGLHYEKVMERETLSQCIYLFVEGDSEEAAIPKLLARSGIDLEKEGIVIANYNGIRNLPHVIRIMGITLSHNRPIIVTYDDDLDGKRVMGNIIKLIPSYLKISFQPIPSTPVVTFNNGTSGGSLEESFDPYHFIDICFQEKYMPSSIASDKQIFISLFDKNRPWLSQICQFCKKYHYLSFGNQKIKIAYELSDTCKSIPISFLELAKLVKSVREKYPITHPNDIDIT